MKINAVLILIGFFCQGLSAQDWQWWNELHDWDGRTPWRDYIQLSSSGLGPNALPVPEFKSMGIQNGFRLENRIRYHHFSEDPTFDYFIRLDYGIQDRLGVAVWMVPVEYFSTSIELRNERKLRLQEPRGFTSGDVYFGTYMQVLRESSKRPDLLLSANIKTASGNNFGGGRHTDVPAYYFDALVAKTFGKFRPYLSTGLYVYQTWSTRNYQNDAWMYGLGFHYLGNSMNYNLEWAGYNGYFQNGDRPSVLRLAGEKKMGKNHLLSTKLQFAINDLDYHTISLGYTYIY